MLCVVEVSCGKMGGLSHEQPASGGVINAFSGAAIFMSPYGLQGARSPRAGRVKSDTLSRTPYKITARC